MRIASWTWGGRDHVGTLSVNGLEATPLAVADASRGALGVIQALARGEPLPPASGTRLPVDAITLRAPLPQATAQPVLRRAQLPRACGRAGHQRLPRQPAERRPLAHRLRQIARMRDRAA